MSNTISRCLYSIDSNLGVKYEANIGVYMLKKKKKEISFFVQRTQLVCLAYRVLDHYKLKLRVSCSISLEYVLTVHLPIGNFRLESHSSNLMSIRKF